MVSDHGKAEDQLLLLAKSRGIEIPSAVVATPPDNPTLKKLQGAEFDRNYAHMMVAGHRQTIQLFEKYGITGKDPDVRAFAEKSLPPLKDHLAMIVAIAATLDAAATQ
jgi:putative membrane protein